MYTVEWYKNYRKKKRNKYNANKREYNGAWYDSGLEANVAQELDWRVKAGEIEKWERQKKLPLDINGKHITNYYIDFITYLPDGSREFIEVKGYQTELWRIKWLMFEALFDDKFRKHPDDKLIIIK